MPHEKTVYLPETNFTNRELLIGTLKDRIQLVLIAKIDFGETESQHPENISFSSLRIPMQGVIMENLLFISFERPLWGNIC